MDYYDVHEESVDRIEEWESIERGLHEKWKARYLASGMKLAAFWEASYEDWLKDTRSEYEMFLWRCYERLVEAEADDEDEWDDDEGDVDTVLHNVAYGGEPGFTFPEPDFTKEGRTQ